MLDISKISLEGAYDDKWRKLRLGKITASNFGKLIGEESDKGKFTDGAITYIDGIVGEIMTGLPARQEFNTVNTDYGNSEEPDAINYFEEFTGKKIFRSTDRGESHRLIIVDQYTACTPDALVAMSRLESIFDESGTKIKVAPLEVKCPPVLQNFMKLYRCETPLHLQKAQKLYFWQALTQMIWTDSLIGFFSPYHMAFPNRAKVITFKKSELIREVKFAEATWHYAKEKIKKELEYFKTPIKWQK